MEKVVYSENERITLIEANGFVVRKNKISSIVGRDISTFKESFAYKQGRKYTVDKVFDDVVKDLLYRANPGGGGGGFYNGSASIDITGTTISVIPGGISHDHLADISANNHHSETHVLATSGPHSGKLPVTDLAHYEAGALMYDGATHWTILSPGTEGYVLKMGATYPEWGVAPTTPHVLVSSSHTASGLTTGHIVRATGATTFVWAQLQHGDLGGVTSDQHHSEGHILSTITGPHTGSLPLSDLGSWAAGRLIYGAISDWSVIAPGTQNYVLKMGATYPGWAIAPVTTHAMDSATYHTSTDVTTLNATTTKHGFLKKLANDASKFMNGIGNWATPTGTVAFGTTKQVPYMNAAGNNFLYSDNLTFDGNILVNKGHSYRQYSTEAGKTDWRITIYTSDADLTKIFNYDEGGAAFRNMVLGNTTNFLYLDLANTRIGVNRANPAYTLDVNGTGRYTGAFYLSGIGNTAAGEWDAILWWDSVAGKVTKTISGGGTTNYLRADGTWAAPPGSGMIYPGAGIALSTGSAWGASIANNSSNWNAAYSHSQNNNQAHSDYLKNNASDYTSGSITAYDFILHD